MEHQRGSFPPDALIARVTRDAAGTPVSTEQLPWQQVLEEARKRHEKAQLMLDLAQVDPEPAQL